MNNYTPDDLLKQWPGKYESWKFSLNGKGEYIGSNGKLNGKIVSGTDEAGNEIPTLELRQLTSTGGMGGNLITQGLRSMTKGLGSTDIDIKPSGIKTCSICKRQYSSSTTKCAYCGVDLE